MALQDAGRDTVITYLRSMQAGATGIDSILALYADDGVYVEHLTSAEGQVRTHHGKSAIREALTNGLKWKPPDLQVALDRIEIEGQELVAHWTCSSAQFARPMSGTDRDQLRQGKIARLETKLDG